MRMGSAWARGQFGLEPVARLATVDSDCAPHIVPIVFALHGDVIYFAVDDKPKSGTRLRRLENIADNARVSVLVDHYADDWSALWWARADGLARVIDDGAEERDAVDLLAGRYPPYVTRRPPGPVVAIAVDRWSGWRAGTA